MPDSDLNQMMQAAGARLKGSALMTGVCWWFAVCLGLWLVLFVFDGLLSLPSGLRLPLAVGGAAVSGLYLFRKVLRPAWRKQTLEQTALALEQRYHVPDNLLINAVQFQRQQLRPEEWLFAEQTLASASEFTHGLRFEELWDWRRLRLWGGAASVVFLCWTGFVLFFPRQFSAAATRYALPLADTPPAGNLILTLSPGSDVTVAEGENLDVALAVRAPDGHGLSKPPVVEWKERQDFIEPVPGAGETAVMTPAGGNPEPDSAVIGAFSSRKFFHTFANIRAPFAFRVFAGDNYTRSVRVAVRPRPRLKDAVFRVTPPAYTGKSARDLPGPPAALAALPGSVAAISFKVEPAIASASWIEGRSTGAFARADGRWQKTTTVSQPDSYEIQARFGAGDKPVAVARGEIQLVTDHPPEVDFITDNRNRLVEFGQKLKLDVQARDDFGLANLEVMARPMDGGSAGIVVKRWTYIGPPGNAGPVRESFSLVIDPRAFHSGAAYYLEAEANDFRPGGQPSRSRPIILRVRSEEDMALKDGDPLGPGFDELKQAIASQEKVNRLTANFRAYLDDIVKKGGVRRQGRTISAEENTAREHCARAATLFDRHAEGQAYAQPLNELSGNEMVRVRDDLRGLASRSQELPGAVSDIQKREEAILERLRGLLGQLADARGATLNPPAEGPDAQAAVLAQEARQRKLLNDVKSFLADQERILEKSRTLADQGPEDLTQQQDALLGELSSDESKWAKFFEDQLTDFSKLPQQDFADSSLAEELNSVYQEVQQAAGALTEKKVELAVPSEQGGIENAQELVNNLERWLPDKPDTIQWSMEEPNAPLDVAMAELPKELEDIVGELLDKEQAMTPDVQDVTSSWMDSADKGAGWGAGDGPISDMSAKGVTGNLLPNQNEVGGRSGEGRTGRSHGQMVSDTAEGKGGQETPTRLKPEPFEQGSVADASKQDPGGATGGGKLSGAAGEGLRGPSPSSLGGAMPRLADRQAKIRQRAEALALRLRRYHVSSGDLENSVNAMSALESAARKNDGLGVRRAFSQAVNSLGHAKKTVDDQVTLMREQNRLPAWMRNEIRTGVRDGIPKGYEEMAGEYFRALAEGRTK